MIRPQLERFIEQIGENSVAIIPAAREVIRSHDTEYKFHQNPDFYYLTGFSEPDAIAVVSPGNKETPFVLFVRPRDKVLEIWNGHRYGIEGAVEKFGASKAFDIADFHKEIGALINGREKLYYRLGVHQDVDRTLLDIFADFRRRGRKGFHAPPHVVDPGVLLHEARLIKTPEEIEIMREAAKIAVETHVAAMRGTKPGVNEYEIDALLEYEFRKRGASGVAYNSIVAGGANACILHYVENNQQLRDGDLVLIDAGANFKGYASDITRTFPVNGKFTEAQRDVYNAVLRVEKACLQETRAGVTVKERQDLSIRLLTEEMLSLGLLKGNADEIIEKKEYERFYMHGVGHYLGMDVHDAGMYFTDVTGANSRPLEAGMMLTVEPGLYIAPDEKDVPEKYLGIGIRIEDDILITADGNENLTVDCPKEVEEIEEIMAAAR